MHGFNDEVLCCFVGDDMNEVVAGDMDNTLRVLNDKNGKQKWTHRLKEEILKCLSVLKIGKADARSRFLNIPC